MSDVCNGQMSHTLAGLGALGIIHRFQSIEKQVEEYLITDINNMSCAIGVTGDYQDRFLKLYDVGCRIFCLDTANGMNIQVKRAINWIRKEFQLDVYLIAGNIATREGYRFLAELSVDGVRVGISGGNVCSTRNSTGVFLPTPQSVSECVEERKNIAFKHGFYNSSEYLQRLRSLPLIIADGGIRNPSDFIKCLSLGADLVMCGRVFAGYKESPGDVIKVDDKLFKLYRGSSSHSVQQDYTQEKPIYNEGNETLVQYTNKSISVVINQFKTGLQSSMSYFGSQNLEEFRNNVSIEVL